MNIFNSLGSNYDFNFVLKSLFSFSDDRIKLINFLENKYNGKAILVYKGREALELALQSLRLPEGSFVAVNGFTCFAVYEAIKNAGLNIQYLDIDKGEINFTPEILLDNLKINPKIRAVIVQNTLGYASDIESISKICKKNNLILIEDLAHSVATKYKNGEESGTIGDFTALSFSQDKMIDAVSGGALIIKRGNNISPELTRLPIRKQIIDKLYPLLTLKIRKTYPFVIGKIIHKTLKDLKLLSSPMDKEDSAKVYNLPGWYTNLVMNAFEDLEVNLSHRKKIAYIYSQRLNPKILSQTLLQQINSSSNIRFPIFVLQRENLIKYLKNNGVFISDIWYDAPVAPKKYMNLTDYKGQCPNAELASGAILNLPTHKNVSESDAIKISSLINSWLSK